MHECVVACRSKAHLWRIPSAVLHNCRFVLTCSSPLTKQGLPAQGGGEKLTDEAIEDTLEKVVKLLAYISDKDLFAEFYRKKLARRLLHDRSTSDEHERGILSRLKQQCGAQFTSKVLEQDGLSMPTALALCSTQTALLRHLSRVRTSTEGVALLLCFAAVHLQESRRQCAHVLSWPCHCFSL